MNTPIFDFVRKYAESESLRLHMPGHKGRGPLGVEALDITEINGADSLWEASGIIRESERNASALFGCETLYSTEGSSLCIRAMLMLALLRARELGHAPRVAFGRNAHKVALTAAALLDIDPIWLYPRGGSYLSCDIDTEAVEALFEGEETPCAVYLTSPDYLGGVADVKALAEICHRHGALLLVDCAHGAYLRFLPESRHPIDLGADLVCASAHKTLPVLTGGAYLHISPSAPDVCRERARDALATFGSTSPSYLILESLDLANAYLADGYTERLAAFAESVSALKERLCARGFELWGDEPLKITLATKSFGYRGDELADALAERGLVCEFADPDFTVMMLTPDHGDETLVAIEDALAALPRRAPIESAPPQIARGVRRLSPREAMLSRQESLPVDECLGRVLANPTVACPPAVPIVVSGEEIDRAAVAAFRYYGIERCTVVSDQNGKKI